MESADYRPAGGGRGGTRRRAVSGSDRHAAEALRGWRIPRVRVPGVRADSRGIRGAVRGRGRKRSPWCARDHAGRRPHGFRRLRDGAVLRRGGRAAGPRPRLRDVGTPARCGPGRRPDRRFLAFAARRGPERARRPRTGRRPRRDRGRRPAQGVSRPGSDSPGRRLPAAAHGASGPAAGELPCRYRHHDRRPGVLARELDLHHRKAETGRERRPCRSGAHRARPEAFRLARWTSSGPGRWWLAVWLRLSRQHFSADSCRRCRSCASRPCPYCRGTRWAGAQEPGACARCCWRGRSR